MSLSHFIFIVLFCFAGCSIDLYVKIHLTPPRSRATLCLPIYLDTTSTKLSMLNASMCHREMTPITLWTWFDYDTCIIRVKPKSPESRSRQAKLLKMQQLYFRHKSFKIEKIHTSTPIRIIEMTAIDFHH